MDDEQLYEIKEGVRRAKAAQICGKEQIKVQENIGGPIFSVPIKNLRSPKDEIEFTRDGGFRWHRVLRATQRSEALPPLLVWPGARGIPIENVEVPQNELDAFRQP